MARATFFYFTIEGDNLDVVAAKETIGLPCNTYTKGQKSLTRLKNEVISKSTRWVYNAYSHEETNTYKKTSMFLAEHLEIISKKLPILYAYIKKYKAIIEIVIYEDASGKDSILLTKKIIKLLNKIGVEFSISFK